MSGIVQEAGDRRRRRLAPLLSLAAVGAVFAGVVAGFFGFAERVTASAPPADARAEAIVVLTGGAARIDSALELLSEGRAGRLLISGVNPTVGREALAATFGDGLRRILECCVDLDHNARDTIENAAETRRWADARGFTSLIVVTSNYHMPRSMAELAGAMPDKRLIPFPVSNPDLPLADWWKHPKTFVLLAGEYGKFLLAEARNLLPAGHPARAASR